MIFRQNGTVMNKTLVLQCAKGLPREKLKLKKNELPEELIEKGDICSRMAKGLESIVTSIAERSDLDFLKNRTGEPKVIILPVNEKVKRKERSMESAEINDEILQPEKLKVEEDIMSMTQDDLTEQEKKPTTLSQTITG